MLRIKLTDPETLAELERRAKSERRPLDLQAEVMLRQALGLKFPYDTEPGGVSAVESKRASTNT